MKEDEVRLTPGARRILEVASQLFYRDGIHAVGVDTIAAESGVTKRTLYDRFGSKDALVAAYLRRRHELWWQQFEQRIAGAESPRALVVFDAYLDDASMVSRGCAFVNAAAELPRDHAAYTAIREHKQAVRDRLASWWPRTALTTPRRAGWPSTSSSWWKGRSCTVGSTTAPDRWMSRGRSPATCWSKLSP